MITLKRSVSGLGTALVSLALLLGGFSISLAEGNRVAPTATQYPSATPTWQSFTPQPASPTSPPATITLTATLPPPPTGCPAPATWIPYQVQAGESLSGLAAERRISAEELGLANCLVSDELLAGVIIYVPPMATVTPIPCGPPDDWVRYTVRRGDTLYAISRSHGIQVADLQAANCMTSTLLRVGQSLYVPPGAVSSTPTAGIPLSFTLIPVSPTEEYFETPTETFFP
jgi:LysM repeat protein